MHSSVFPMAMMLAQGRKLALASWFLGSLYAWLDECCRNVNRSMGRYDAVSYIEANLLQLFCGKDSRSSLMRLVRLRRLSPRLWTG